MTEQEEWPIGCLVYFTEDFITYVYGIEPRKGEFDFGGVTWRHRWTAVDEYGHRSFRCERVR